MYQVDNGDKGREDEHEADYGVEGYEADHGEAEGREGKDEEHEDEVEDGEPAVAGGHVAQEPRHGDGQPHHRQRVEHEDSQDVEDEVDERDLDGRLEVLALGREARQDAGGGRADVTPEGQRVDGLQGHEAGATKRRERGGEDRGGADEEGDHRADQHGEVACQPGTVGDVGVDRVLDDDGHPLIALLARAVSDEWFKRRGRKRSGFVGWN